jgi:hypothetical protein
MLLECDRSRRGRIPLKQSLFILVLGVFGFSLNAAATGSGEFPTGKYYCVNEDTTIKLTVTFDITAVHIGGIEFPAVELTQEGPNKSITQRSRGIASLSVKPGDSLTLALVIGTSQPWVLRFFNDGSIMTGAGGNFKCKAKSA